MFYKVRRDRKRDLPIVSQGQNFDLEVIPLSLHLTNVCGILDQILGDSLEMRPSICLHGTHSWQSRQNAAFCNGKIVVTKGQAAAGMVHSGGGVGSNGGFLKEVTKMRQIVLAEREAAVFHKQKPPAESPGFEVRSQESRLEGGLRVPGKGLISCLK